MTRRSTPAAGVEEFVTEPDTGVISDPDERAKVRARRDTDERIARLEQKHDKLVQTVTGVGTSVATMSGKLDTVLDFIKSDRDNTHKTERVRIGSRARMIVGVVGAVCAAIGAVVAALVSQGCSS